MSTAFVRALSATLLGVIAFVAATLAAGRGDAAELPLFLIASVAIGGLFGLARSGDS